VAQQHPVPMRCVGVRDRFGTSGDPAQLLEVFHLMPQDIVQAAQGVLSLKSRTLR
jgi:transketolase